MPDLDRRVERTTGFEPATPTLAMVPTQLPDLHDRAETALDLRRRLTGINDASPRFPRSCEPNVSQ
jgi:hypothetical protein